MDLEKKIKKNIKQYKLFGKNEKLILAVSGGVDSAVLLNVLNNVGYKPVIVHLNHSLRGKNSERDQKFVKDLAKIYKLKFETKKIDVKKIAKQKKANLEETAREERYRFLENMAKKHKVTKIITAHHADDQVETVLLNYLRGAGPRGLSGMSYISGENLKIIRPMLNVWRKDIESYQKKNNLEFRQDKSNFDTKITRNYLRLKLIPALEKKNKGFKEKIFEESMELKELNNLLEPQIEKVYRRLKLKEFPEAIVLDKNRLKGLPDNLKIEILKRAVVSLAGNLKNISKKHLTSFLENLKKDFPGKTVVLPGQLRVSFDYDTLVMHRKTLPKLKIKKTGLKIGSNLVFSAELNIKLVIKNKQSKEKEFIFDFDKIKAPIYVRALKAGDKFKPKGFAGTKKLQNLFVDSKIPQSLRGLIPIITDKNGNILGTLGIRQGDMAKPSKNTKKFLTINFKGINK